MLQKWQNLENINRKKREILSSKQTIFYFQKSIDDYIHKNRTSNLLIKDWEESLTILTEKFEEKNKISFEEAQKLVSSSFSPDKNYNLDEYNQILHLRDQISSEKFFINHRTFMINKNQNFIDETTKWIKALEAEIEKYQNL